jgi:hypothetical protein
LGNFEAVCCSKLLEEEGRFLFKLFTQGEEDSDSLLEARSERIKMKSSSIFFWPSEKGEEMKERNRKEKGKKMEKKNERK